MANNYVRKDLTSTELLEGLDKFVSLENKYAETIRIYEKEKLILWREYFFPNDPDNDPVGAQTLKQRFKDALFTSLMSEKKNE